MGRLPSRRLHRSFTLLVFCFALRGAAAEPATTTPSDHNAQRLVFPTVWGDGGLVRVSDAHIAFRETSLSLHGFGAYLPDFVAPQRDPTLFGGTWLAGSFSAFHVVELAIAAKAAATSNTVAGMQASVLDTTTSLKLGYGFGPVALAALARAHWPTRTAAPGFDLRNVALTGRVLGSLDLTTWSVPVRIHGNVGYQFQIGKYGDDQQFFEQNPYFLDGVSGHLLALAVDQRFYDSAAIAVGVEVPLPWATPFFELQYEAALGVPDNRGAGGKAYDYLSDAHTTFSPGVRVTPWAGLSIALAVDVGLTGNAGGFAAYSDAAVAGQPINPMWLGRIGVAHVFALAAPPRNDAALKGCVTDAAGAPIKNATVESPALLGGRLVTDDSGCFVARGVALVPTDFTVVAMGFAPAVLHSTPDATATVQLARRGDDDTTTTSPAAARTGRVRGYVTNRDDSSVAARILIDDGQRVQTIDSDNGAFEAETQSGRVVVVTLSDRGLATGAEVLVEPGETARVQLLQRPLPKKRSVTLTAKAIETTARIPFEYKKARLQSSAEYVLDEVVDVLLRDTSLKLRVDVYAEAVGTDVDNQHLADERAAWVLDYLARHGVRRERLTAHGVAGVEDKFRRVEFVRVP